MYVSARKKKRGCQFWAFEGQNPPDPSNVNDNNNGGGGTPPGTDPNSGANPTNNPPAGNPGTPNPNPGTPDPANSNNSEDFKVKYGDDTPLDALLEQFPEFKGNKTLARYKNVGEMIKGFTELDSKVGTMISLPDKDASEEEKSAALDKIYQKLGKPESADKYELPAEVPEGLQFNETLQKKYKDFAHKNNFTAAQAKAAQDFWNQELGETLKEFSANQRIAEETNLSEQVSSLKAAWGSEYKTRTQIAVNTTRSLLSKETRDFLDKTGLGNNANFIKDMYDISKKFSGDSTPITGGNNIQGETYDTLTSEAMKIKQDPIWQNDPVKRDRIKYLDTRRAELKYEKKD